MKDQLYFREILLLQVILEAKKNGITPTQKILVGDPGDYESGLLNKAIADLNSQERATFNKSVDTFSRMINKLREAELLKPSGKYIATKKGERFIESLPKDMREWPAVIPYKGSNLDLKNAIYYSE